MAAPGGAAVVRHQDGVRPGDDIAGVRRHAGDPVEDLRGALAAARERFTAQGYVATTTEQIAERAGVSKPTVFASAVDLYFMHRRGERPYLPRSGSGSRGRQRRRCGGGRRR
jgi:hypothetical protein